MSSSRVALCSVALIGTANSLVLDSPRVHVPEGVCADTVPNQRATEDAFLETHQSPKWYQDVKLGISVHWGLYSVPAFAGVAPVAGKAGATSPSSTCPVEESAERYYQSSMTNNSKHQMHFKTTYGEEPSAESYSRHFVPAFNAESKKWQPEAWAELFKSSGAKYVVAAANSYDGFSLWNSAIANPMGERSSVCAERDIIGELTEAVRNTGMEMGLSYAGDFYKSSCQPTEPTQCDVAQEDTYAEFAHNQLNELIERYKPSIVLGKGINDRYEATSERLMKTFSDYFNKHCRNGVVSSKFFDGQSNTNFTGDFVSNTCETSASAQDVVQAKTFQLERPISHSLGLNDAEPTENYMTPASVARLLAHVVSMNGRLLLDVGPRADGSLHELQTLVLRDLGTWMDTNAEAIHGARPFLEPGMSPSEDFRLTRTEDDVYVIIMEPTSESVIDFGVKELQKPGRVLTVEVLSPGGNLKAAQMPDGRLILPQAANRLAALKDMPLVVKLHLAWG